MTKRHGSRIKKGIFIVILLLLLGIIVYKAFPYATIDFTKFDPAVWDKYYLQRHNMIDDLENRYTLEGMTIDEITALLGERYYWYTDGTSHMRAQISYAVDTTMVGVFYEYYLLKLDENGKCTDTHRYRD